MESKKCMLHFNSRQKFVNTYKVYNNIQVESVDVLHFIKTEISTPIFIAPQSILSKKGLSRLNNSGEMQGFYQLL